MMKRFHKRSEVLFFSFFFSLCVADNYQRQHKFSFEGWMSAICRDFALNLGNICEHGFLSFLNPLSHSCCALAEHHDHLTNCVGKDVPRVMIPLPKVS